MRRGPSHARQFITPQDQMLMFKYDPKAALKVLRWEERDKRLIIKDAELVA
jgi:hypothetical protein